MKRILIYLNFIAPKKTSQRNLPETLVNEEMARLLKRVPRTHAELAFHAWLVEWKTKIDKADGGNK